ncbi:NirD/YgiW/YdeI family stress tolerance protein [Chitinophaga sp. 30R24]|uniref:NirD/YgiW/YdeI family stress tolerance protein n=1 Tax=Chitinophaga sp. 30R24 TaxID=3248838 RepID=UPI003B906095
MSRLFFCLLLPLLAFQQRNWTIGDVMRNARQLHNDSTQVQIIGYLTKKLPGNSYIFEDKTAEIQVNIDPRFMPSRPVSDREPVTLKVLVEYEINRPITLKANQPVGLE